MDGTRPGEATRREIALGIERLGGQQKQLIRIEQLVGLGLSQRGVHHRVGSRTLFRVHEAAWLLGATEAPPSLPHLTNRTGAGRTSEQFVVHRRMVDPKDVFRWSGIPCTRPERTVLDCAASSADLKQRLQRLTPYRARSSPSASRSQRSSRSITPPVRPSVMWGPSPPESFAP